MLLRHNDDILALVKLDLNLAYFRWRESFFKQVKEFGMGKSTSSPLSDIYMEDFEAAALASYPTGDSNISPGEIVLFWLRKADDTLVPFTTTTFNASITTSTQSIRT